MQTRHKKIATSAAIAIGAVAVLAVSAALFVRAGIYNIGADDPHYATTYSMLEQLREASIRRRASKLIVPADLDSPARITQGAGNYNAMCTQCHLAPGMEPTELSRGLYPAAPNLTREQVDAAEAFWTIKHGIKASGMPAWGGSMDDEYIWNMAAFLQQLPKLDAASYQALVARSGGHSHGGGETGAGAHHHDAEEGDADMAGMEMGDEASPHTHASGTPEHEDAAPAHAHAPGTPPHDDAASAHAHAPGTPPHDDAAPAPAHTHAPGTPAHDDAAPAHAHAPGAPPHDDAPAHVDPPGTPPHSH